MQPSLVLTDLKWFEFTPLLEIACFLTSELRANENKPIYYLPKLDYFVVGNKRPRVKNTRNSGNETLTSAPLTRRCLVDLAVRNELLVLY